MTNTADDRQAHSQGRGSDRLTWSQIILYTFYWINHFCYCTNFLPFFYIKIQHCTKNRTARCIHCCALLVNKRQRYLPAVDYLSPRKKCFSNPTTIALLSQTVSETKGKYKNTKHWSVNYWLVCRYHPKRANILNNLLCICNTHHCAWNSCLLPSKPSSPILTLMTARVSYYAFSMVIMLIITYWVFHSLHNDMYVTNSDAVNVVIAVLCQADCCPFRWYSSRAIKHIVIRHSREAIFVLSATQLMKMSCHSFIQSKFRSTLTSQNWPAITDNLCSMQGLNKGNRHEEGPNHGLPQINNDHETLWMLLSLRNLQ